MIITTNTIEGRPVRTYHGLVVGEAIMGANAVHDLFARVTDVIGGRSGAYEIEFEDARDAATAHLTEQARAMGADAVIGVDLDYEVVGESMPMVSISGTAVTLS